MLPGIDWAGSKRDHVLDGIAHWIIRGEYHSSQRHLKLSVDERWDIFYKAVEDAFHKHQEKLEAKIESIEKRILRIRNDRDSRK
jgi:hypothetical protein